MTARFEECILANLCEREPYARKVIPFISRDYFLDQADRIVFDLIANYVDKYNRFPTKEVLVLDLDSKQGMSADVHDAAEQLIGRLQGDPKTEIEWLVERTEKFCQEKAVYNAIMKSIQILDNKDPKLSKQSIPQVLQDALGVSFDTHIGHDFMADSDSRYEYYHRKEHKIPFNIDLFNQITKGGLPRKTLSVLMASTGVGKSMFMCNFAAGNLLEGKNVLYITLEMAEEEIAKRIDANLLDIPLDELDLIPKDAYDRKIARIRGKTSGRLIIKEYPTSSAGSANFRHLLNELKIKSNFVPDVIYIDYLNICSSSRIKLGASINSYMYVKAIAEELRGLAVEFNVPIISATQTNREGYNNSDVDITNTSESIGLPATLDLMLVLITSEELEKLGQIMVKQLKNRFNDINFMRRFVVGVERSKMKLYDLDQKAQEGIIDDDAPVMDKTSFGKAEKDREFFSKKPKFPRKGVM